MSPQCQFDRKGLKNLIKIFTSRVSARGYPPLGKRVGLTPPPPFFEENNEIIIF